MHRSQSPAPRAPMPIAFALAIATALTACTSRPTLQSPRPLSAPLHSAVRVFDLWFSPTAIASDARACATATGALLGREFERGSTRRTLNLLAAEPGRAATLADDASALVGSETARLGNLARPPHRAEFDPRRTLARLRASLRRLPALLQLDRRALGEPDDRQHRTDPDDDHPEASWFARLARRLLP